MLPADLAPIVNDSYLQRPGQQADDARRSLRQDPARQPLGDLVRAMPCRDAGAECASREAGGENFEVVAVNVDTGDDVKPKKFLAETKVDSLAFYRENTLALFEDLQKRGLVARPTGDAACRSRTVACSRI